MSERTVIRTIRGRDTSDGDGVRLTRLIGTNDLPDLDPFLMLDAFGSDEASDYIGGFPDHPHRGFETVTYMLAGRMRHRDNQGNSGLLTAGSVQWMTAGRGIVHSEMPEQDNGRMAGFQLWVNLPARLKMMAPRYQDIPPEDVPNVVLNAGAKARVLAGRVGECEGPVRDIVTAPLYLDVTLEAGSTAMLAMAAGHTSFAYVFEGMVAFGPALHAEPVEAGMLAVFSPGTSLQAKAGSSGGRFILLAGQPIGEPVAKYGPFVMNSVDEIRQAIRDYQMGRF